MKKKCARSLALLLCCVMFVTIMACSKPSNPANPSNSANPTNSNASNTTPGKETPAGTPVSARDTLTVAISQDSGTLLPNGMSQLWLPSVGRMLCEPLWDYNADGEIVYILAESVDGWDGTVWTIHLRQGVYFSNGGELTAEDIGFSIKWAKDYVAGQYREFNLDKSRIIDKYTYELVLDPYGYAPQFGASQLFIYDSETFDPDDFVMNPIGTGPYVKDEYVVNSHLNLKAREDYWGGAPRIKNLHFKVFNEDAQKINALQTGQVDVLAPIPSQEIEFAQTIPGYEVITYSNRTAPNLTFNFDARSPMSTLDARLAVSYAIDTNAVINLVYFGHASPNPYPISVHCRELEPALLEMVHETVYPTARDVEKAKAYAESAGLVGKEIRVVTNGTPAYVTTAEIVQANLKDIGVNVVIDNYDAASYTDVAKDPTRFDILVTATGSPSGLANSMFSNYVMWYPTRYEGGIWDGYKDYLLLAQTVMSTPSAAERQEMLYQISRQFMDNMLWFALCELDSSIAVNSELGDVRLWNNGNLRFNEWYWKS